MNWSEEMVDAVWNKGEIIKNTSPDVARKDYRGNEIHRKYYGHESRFGWEIDHIVPKSKGGPDILDNLRPVQSSVNAARVNSAFRRLTQEFLRRPFKRRNRHN